MDLLPKVETDFIEEAPPPLKEEEDQDLARLGVDNEASSIIALPDIVEPNFDLKSLPRRLRTGPLTVEQVTSSLQGLHANF